ncbi:zinc finger MYM-type protein 1-like [Aphis gossypii]|uniref:zinc finger MYM-type protein 1-like n=1 Tax=Aphis gossypii TaxID=80765 RepID=UPI002158AE19|nr:zinc finger MYM-type protein 1-like [Aphis gossypii]
MAKKITDFFTVSESDSGLLKRKLKDIDESNKVDDKKVKHKQLEPECTSPIVPKNDVSLFINRTLSDIEKHVVLTNLWSPPLSHSFPLLKQHVKRKIKFQYRWLEKYCWLCYSEKLEGAFCKYCIVFARTGGIGSQTLGSLVLNGFQNWKNALEVFEKHNEHEYHKVAILKGENFLKLFSKSQPNIIEILDDERLKQKKQNRANIIPIIKCVILCGRQELALRGHTDFGPICFKSESEPYINEGNFRAILKYKAEDMEHLKNFLESDGRYKYTSSKIQNEIISSCGDLILKKIVKEVNMAACFSVLADETTDISVKEQLSICVRYVAGSGTDVYLCERFLMYIEIDSLTGKDLAFSIINGLNSCGVNCSNMHGQGYDGASNMAGRFKGTQTIVRETYPKALYVHCAAHSLNWLCLQLVRFKQ